LDSRFRLPSGSQAGIKKRENGNNIYKKPPRPEGLPPWRKSSMFHLNQGGQGGLKRKWNN